MMRQKLLSFVIRLIIDCNARCNLPASRITIDSRRIEFLKKYRIRRKLVIAVYLYIKFPVKNPQHFLVYPYPCELSKLRLSITTILNLDMFLL